MHNRLRAGTIFEHSKTDLLKWLRAIYFVMQGKRGVSALELQRHLGMKSYGTVWSMLHKIREALRQRDEDYKLKGQIELDGAVFGRRETGTQREVLVAGYISSEKATIFYSFPSRWLKLLGLLGALGGENSLQGNLLRPMSKRSCR